MTISVLNIIDGTIVDGPGLRISIYAAGCSHKCPGCHNPQSWEINNGVSQKIDDIFEIIKNSPWNVTFSGGDPFFQAEGFAALAKKIKDNTDKTIWCYTGYRYEEIIANLSPSANELLKYTDILVDGPFDQNQRNLSLKFRGSSNQRFIDVKLSIINKSVCEYTLPVIHNLSL